MKDALTAIERANREMEPLANALAKIGKEFRERAEAFQAAVARACKTPEVQAFLKRAQP